MRGVELSNRILRRAEVGRSPCIRGSRSNAAPWQVDPRACGVKSSGYPTVRRSVDPRACGVTVLSRAPLADNPGRSPLEVDPRSGSIPGCGFRRSLRPGPHWWCAAYWPAIWSIGRGNCHIQAMLGFPGSVPVWFPGPEYAVDPRPCGGTDRRPSGPSGVKRHPELTPRRHRKLTPRRNGVCC